MTSDTTSKLTTPPPASGVRVTWDGLPERIRQLIEERLGSRVEQARSQPGGFSPGLASILTTENGQTVFIKAAGPELNPDTPSFHRREAAVVAALPV